jgi:small subunit ribosomal protein S11
MATESKKKKIKKNKKKGIAHVNATFNNTIITITDTKGNTISWSSAGAEGFKGSRKSTPFAAQLAAENAGKKAKDNGVKTLEIEVRALSADSLPEPGPLTSISRVFTPLSFAFFPAFSAAS